MAPMQIQNKYKHLHYLVCLGSGLRKANADITRDALPEQMRDQLHRMAGAAETGSASARQDRKAQRRG